jgi:hypothetical protein
MDPWSLAAHCNNWGVLFLLFYHHANFAKETFQRAAKYGRCSPI